MPRSRHPSKLARFSLRHALLVAVVAPLLASCATSLPLLAQSSTDGAGAAQPTPKKSHAEDDLAPVQLTPEQQQERLREFKKEVGKTYQKWLNEDVAYIITPEEKRAFELLGTDEERDAFIDQFWRRRNPDSDSPVNTFREEYYRRVQYANEHFSAGVPGWRTDRGHIYIVWGPPDQIDSRPAGGTYQRTITEGGGTTSTYPFERWTYRHLDGIGDNVVIEFVDTCMCNDYHIALDPNEKDALLGTGGGATMLEQMGFGNPAARMYGLPNPMNPNGPGSGTNQFSALEQYVKLTEAPPIKFRDLEEKVDTHIRYNLVPFDMRSDFLRITPDTDLVPITIRIKTSDLTFKPKNGIQHAAVNIFGRISTLSGHVADTFEDTINVDEPSDLMDKALHTSQFYWKAIPLKPGLYKIDLALKDVNGDRVGTLARSLRVPEFDEDRLSSSSLILADQMERVSTKDAASSNFILGDARIRPRPDSADGKPASFQRSQRLNFWMQVYNLQQDPRSHKTRATITYDIVNAQTQKSVLHSSESSDAYGSNPSQITLAKILPLSSLDPGTYNLKITVDDEVAKQTIAPSARFQVE